jgi:hypothetical protein
LKDDVRDAVNAAYAKLIGLAKKRVAGRPYGELALERHGTAPQKWESVLTGELAEAGAANDTNLVTAARTLMDLVDEVGVRTGKYNVMIKDSTGVQIGDDNIQINRF